VKGAADPAAASDASDRLIAQVERAAEVVRRLRNFIRQGRSETSATPVARLVEEAVAYCHVELDDLGVELQSRVARDLPAVRADALQIEQVIVNLVRNAAEALTDAGRYDGKVAVEAEHDAGGCVVVRVRDNGPGFDPDLVERAVTPFTTTKIDGLGLGLSLVRSIVEAHGGRLSIESGSSGATVSFTLPVLASER
jgi:two-component system sensor kinase FixL